MASIFVSIEDDKNIIKSILNRGADIETKNKEKETALLIASKKGYKEIVELLLDNGADIEVRTERGYTALLIALLRGNKEIIQLLLDRGANIGVETDENFNAISIASFKGDKEIVQLLLDNGANIKTRDNSSTSILMASYHGHKEIVQLLLNNGADIETKDFGLEIKYNLFEAVDEFYEENLPYYKMTPLIISAEKGYTEIVQLLLESGADIETRGVGIQEYGFDGNQELFYLVTPLIIASERGNTEIVKLLLQSGADIEAKGTIKRKMEMYTDDKEAQEQYYYEHNYSREHSRSDGITSLLIALEKGHKEIVKLLVEAGAKINTQSDDGSNALLRASEKGYKEIVQLLLNNGANIDVKSDNGSNALLGASLNGHKEIVQLLLDNGANIDVKSDNGSNALLEASKRGHKKIVQLLLEAGANIETKIQGYTPLLIFSDRGDGEMVQFLLDKGANIEAKDNDDRSALLIASENGYKNIVRLLLNGGADIEATNIFGINSLMISSFKGEIEIVKLLLRKGANRKAKDNSGKNALMMASVKGELEIVKTLFDYDLDLKDNDEMTAIELAYEHGHKKILEFFYADAESGIHIEELYEFIAYSRSERSSTLTFEEALETVNEEDIVNSCNLLGYLKYKKDIAKPMNNPQKLIKILTNFRKDTPIKYTTHLWDMNFNNDYGNFDGYMNKVTEQWEEIEGELENLSPNIHRKVYDFLINTSPTTNWCSKDGDNISIGWSSLEGLKEWCDGGNDPFNFELEKSYTVEDKTVSTFGDIINLFKQEIQIRNENDVLESIFIYIEERLYDEFDGIFEIETIKLKGKSFYTDVEKFKNALARVFSEIKKRQKFNKIVVEMIEYDDYNYMDLTITQIGSSANRTKEDMEKIFNGGDMAEIKKSLINLCDWSIETPDEGESYRIDFLGHIDDNTKIESRGFTHRFRFYR